MFQMFRTFRTTEPTFFNILRLFSASTFTFGLFLYTWVSAKEFVFNIYKPNLYLSEAVFDDDPDYSIGFTFPEFKICPKSSSRYDDNNSLKISLYKLYRDRLNSTLYIPVNYFYDVDNLTDFIPYNLNMTYDFHDAPNDGLFFINDYDDNRCMIFSTQNEYAGRTDFGSGDWDSELLFIITLDNSSIYDYFEINFDSIITESKFPKLFGETSEITENITLVTNQHFITRGKYVIYDFAIRRNIFYSSPFYGILGLKADNIATRIDIDETVLTSIQNNSFTVLELRFNSPYIRDEEERYQNTVGKLISNLGGFYSAVSGTFILLFGAPKLSPWGFCQTSLLCCWPIRRSFKKHLASRYVSHAGIPLAEDPRELPQGAKIDDRVAVLEYLLKEYYLDAYYLEKLRSTRKKYLFLQKQFNDLEAAKILSDDDDDDDDHLKS